LNYTKVCTKIPNSSSSIDAFLVLDLEAIQLEEDGVTVLRRCLGNVGLPLLIRLLRFIEILKDNVRGHLDVLGLAAFAIDVHESRLGPAEENRLLHRWAAL
jgi:hypothetical protein